jgi:16S rRNA (uracil1498-N3)-methyltransferase
MRSPRFLVDADFAIGGETLLPRAVSHHALRVLRLRDGAAITLFTGRGGEYAARLQVDGEQAWAVVQGYEPIERESPLAVTLVQSWTATEKLEWIVEKAVELGVAALIVVPSARSLIRLDGERRERRLQRLNDIAVAACCQSGRNRVPAVSAAETLQSGLQRGLATGGLGLLLDPLSPQTMASAATGGLQFTLAIGPEGGFDDDERALAARSGYRTVALGPRILRTETAGVAALAAIQTLGGDLR